MGICKLASTNKKDAGLCPPEALPRLLSAKEYAVLTGIPSTTVHSMLIKGRLVGAQKVAGIWVVPENAKLLDIGTEEDPTIAELAKYFATEPDLDWSKELPLPRKMFSNPKGTQRPKIRIPGFKRIKEERGLGVREIRRLTKVHDNTQAKMVRGEKVHPSVAIRLAKGLDVDVEEFLRED